MNFVSDLNSRLIETKSFVDLLNTQLKQLTDGYGQAIGDGFVDNWVSNCTRVIATLTEIQKHLLDKCLTADGRRTISTQLLDSVQNVCESLGRMWLDLRAQLTTMTQFYVNRDDCRQLKDGIETNFGELIKRTWIVTLQPPQVIRTNTRFSAVLRCLTGTFISPGPMELVKVRAAILSESQAKILTAIHSFTQPQSRDLVNTIPCSGALSNRETVLLRSCNGMYEAKFSGMTLKKISRSERKGATSVMEEKFGISFTSEVQCADGELIYHVQVFSLPIVVVVHIIQETIAWGTIIWDYHFAAAARLPFEVPDKVSWTSFSQMLSHRFNSECGAHLTQEDLHFLAAKVLRATTPLNYDSMYVSWAKFAKEPLPDLSFTFWEWFASIQKLVRECLKDYWSPSNRLIRGFINRYDCEAELIGRPNGTFLLRFSETALGCLSIAYTVTDRFNRRIVVNLAPFSLRDLSIRSLPDRINDLKDLTHLYPDTPKDIAFGPFYKPVEKSALVPKGYVKSVLVTQVQGWAPLNSASGTYSIEPVSTPTSGSQFYQSPLNSVGTNSPIDTYSPLSSISQETYMDNDIDRIINETNFYETNIEPSTNRLAEFIAGFEY